MPEKRALAGNRRAGRLLGKISWALVPATLWLVTTVRGWPQIPLQAVADRTSYNVGDVVRVRLLFPSPGALPLGTSFSATLRYLGESQPLLDLIPMRSGTKRDATADATGYSEIWKIPYDARTGRYEIEVTARGANSGQLLGSVPRATSFTVHRKLARIARIELDRTFYTSGDPVSCRVTLMNLSGRRLASLRVEFSERYWPWIARSSEQAGVDVFPIAKALSLRPYAQVEVRSSRATVAKSVTEPAVHQYAVVVWDSERKNIYDIAFSPLVFIHPPGVREPKPYPSQYIYPSLGVVNTASYRQFIRPEFTSAGIQFDRSQTMFASGSRAAVSFRVSNPTDQPWRGATILARLQGVGSAAAAQDVVAETIDLAPRESPLRKETAFVLPSEESELFRVVVEIRDGSGQLLATNGLEIAANPLPESILILCAHEDDEVAHAGIIRAAVENSIPLNVVYLTSGDAGSCDRYYQHSCGPAEAMNFGELRMEEARAALSHLGVRRENIHFLGLPDGGLGEIWFRHQVPSNPYLSVLLASNHAPYAEVARPNLPYTRASVVGAIEDFIRRLQPKVIYTGHPDERHVDHRTNNWFVVKALQELRREGAISASVKLLVDQVYGPGPQTHAPYHYEKHVLHVSGEARALAQEAAWFYQSQSGNRALGNLRTFDELPRSEVHQWVLDWAEHEGWNDKE